jgi:hypothetical protein
MVQKHDEKSNSYFIERCINQEVVAVLVNEQNFNDSLSDFVARNVAVAENSSLLFLRLYYYFTGYHFTERVDEKDLQKEYGENINESVQQWLQWCMVQHLIFDLCPLFLHSDWKEILKEDKVFNWCQVVVADNSEHCLTCTVDILNLGKALGIYTDHQVGADKIFDEFLAKDGHMVFIKELCDESMEDGNTNVEQEYIPPISSASMEDLVTVCLFINAAGFMQYLGDNLCS